MLTPDDKHKLQTMEEKLGIPSQEHEDITARLINVMHCIVLGYTYLVPTKKPDDA